MATTFLADDRISDERERGEWESDQRGLEKLFGSVTLTYQIE